MKYETYKQLTKEQKEEWEFKYREKENIFGGSPFYIMWIYMLYIIATLVTYVQIKENMKIEEQLNMYKTTTVITIILLYAWITEVIISLYKEIIRMYKEHKWLKEIKMKK